MSYSKRFQLLGKSLFLRNILGHLWAYRMWINKFLKKDYHRIVPSVLLLKLTCFWISHLCTYQKHLHFLKYSINKSLLNKNTRKTMKSYSWYCLTNWTTSPIFRPTAMLFSPYKYCRLLYTQYLKIYWSIRLTSRRRTTW